MHWNRPSREDVESPSPGIFWMYFYVCALGWLCLWPCRSTGTGMHFSPSLRGKGTFQTPQSSTELPKFPWKTHGLSLVLFLFIVSLTNTISESKEEGSVFGGLLVHGPWQWPTLENNGRKDAVYDYSVFQFPLTFNYPSLLDPECYSIHQLLAALNAFAFPALASSCTESTGSVNWMETKSRLGVQGWRREQGEVFPNKQFCAFLSITWQPCFGEH